MKSNYRRIGDYIRLVDERNTELKTVALLGISIDKEFMPSVANIIGTDLTAYKIIRKDYFACNIMHVGRDERLPIALYTSTDASIVSPAYKTFEICNKNEILPEYLMMWMSRYEFDRHAYFLATNGVRGNLEWEDFCNMELPVPQIKKQREIVAEYNKIMNRIKLNKKINQKLEETAKAIYKNWFVENDEALGVAYLKEYIDFNPKHRIKKNTITSYVEMADLQESNMTILNHVQRVFTAGSKFKNGDTLLARISPCLENGKTAYMNTLEENEVAYGSTEFIVLRPLANVSPYWVYCLARDEAFRNYAISSMVGSSGRQRVHSDYLKEYKIKKINTEKMQTFDKSVSPIFEYIKINAIENAMLKNLSQILLSSISTRKLKSKAA